LLSEMIPAPKYLRAFAGVPMQGIVAIGALSCFIFGCGSGSAGTSATPVPQTLHAAGTSIPQGYLLASPSTQAYPAQVANRLGYLSDNRSLPGSNCMDIMGSNSSAFVPEFNFAAPIADGSLWLFAPGDNNANDTTLTTVAEDTYLGCMRAAIVFAGLPDALWTRPSACTASSDWTAQNTIVGAPALASHTVGGTITCHLPAGQSVNVILDKQWINGINLPNVPFSVSVDGVAAIDPVSNSATFNTIAPNGTQGVSATYAMYDVHVSGLSNTPHVVTVTVDAGGDGANSLMFFGAASVASASFSASSPRVVWPSPIQYTAQGYQSNGTSLVAKTTYDNLEAQVVQQMAADGFNVIHVELMTNAAYNPALNADPDGIHPDLAGATTIANTVSTAMQ
jgi:hypothetical protein